MLQVLDTAGQEEYGSMRRRYMKTGEGFMLVYSVTSRPSFEEITTFQQHILRVKDKDEFPMIVVGSHCSQDSERVVSREEGEALARSLGCKFVEADSEARVNVERAFFELVREIRRYNREMLGIFVEKERPLSTWNSISSTD